MPCISQVGGHGLDWKPLREIAEDAVKMMTDGKQISEVESMIDTRLIDSELKGSSSVEPMTFFPLI